MRVKERKQLALRKGECAIHLEGKAELAMTL
jgi:hypothetical protein